MQKHLGTPNETSNPPRLIPITQWNKYHPWPPLGGLRHLVFHAKKNGFDRVIRRVGRRILLSEQAFFEWVDEQNNEVRL